MKRLWGESELEGSGVVWSMNRALRVRGAALRGVRVPLVPSVSELGVTCDLGAMESDLGRGHLSLLERSERVQERE